MIDFSQMTVRKVKNATYALDDLHVTSLKALNAFRNLIEAATGLNTTMSSRECEIALRDALENVHTSYGYLLDAIENR